VYGVPSTLLINTYLCLFVSYLDHAINHNDLQLWLYIWVHSFMFWENHYFKNMSTFFKMLDKFQCFFQSVNRLAFGKSYGKSCALLSIAYQNVPYTVLHFAF
jgi:hypothetical protein